MAVNTEGPVGHEFFYMGHGCAQTFVSDAAFDAHRIGEHENRRCLTPAEMTTRGWERGRGWRHPKGMRARQTRRRTLLAARPPTRRRGEAENGIVE